MKKIILVFTLVLAIAAISGYRESGRNENTGKNAKQVSTTASMDIKDRSKTGTLVKVTESSPRILFILKSDTGQTKWSPSLWWSYQHKSTAQEGC